MSSIPRALLLLVSIAASLACLAEASLESAGACPTNGCSVQREDAAGTTAGSVLLQVVGKVDKQLVEDLEGSVDPAFVEDASNGSSNSTETKPKIATDNFNFNNNDNLNFGKNTNNDNLNMNDNVDNAELLADVKADKGKPSLDNLNTNDKDNMNNFDITKDSQVKKLVDGKGKTPKGPKNDDKEFNFGNNNDNSNIAGKGTVPTKVTDNFDFGDGPIKIDSEAVEDLKKNVAQAVGRVQKVLDDAEANEKVIKDALNSGEKDMKKLSEKVQKGLDDVTEKMKEAQKELRTLEREMTAGVKDKAASPLGSLPHALILGSAVAVLLW